MVEAEEREHREIAFVTRFVGCEELTEILDHRLRASARSAGEEDQSGGALFPQLGEERVC